MLTRDDMARQLATARRPGFFVLIAVALGIALHAWLARSVLVPIAGTKNIEYVFVSAAVGSFIAAALATIALVFLAHFLIRQATARLALQPVFLSWRDVSYAQPLFWFAASAVPLFGLVPAVGRFLPVVSYVIVDLRWWWTALIGVWLARNIDVRSNGAWHRRIASVQVPTVVRRWAPEVTLAAIAITWAAAGTPVLRSLGGTNGDEPKYVRYCENLYQGLGFDVSQIKAMSQLPADFRPRVFRNFVLVAETLPGELRSLAGDAAAYIRNPSRQFNRAGHRPAGFIDGKDGGMYQVHNPGVSFLMFPAYYVDRQFAHIEPGSAAQWPTNLTAVNTFFLVVYAFWTILIFRFLQKCGATIAVAWVASLAFTLTLPVAAFPYQYYPELAAGFFVSAVGGHILFADPRGRGASFFYGLLAGYLLWLHVRFVGVTAALTIGALVVWRGDRRRSLMFLAGVAMPAALFSLYAYRITGSVLPSALWSVEGSDDNFTWVRMLKNIAPYLLDREWGLFAHSPVLLLALPGYWWMTRRKPAVAGLSALLFFGLLLPAAGKTLGQTTPMRLICAVVPFAATPIIEVLARRGRWIVQIATGLLLILSLDDALSYNLHHYRHLSTLVDWSFSGWKVNLLFPVQARSPWHVSAANGFLLIAWIVVALALLVTPALLHWVRKRGWSPPMVMVNVRSIVRPALTAAGVFVVLSTAISAATGFWTTPDYFIPPQEAAQQAALMVDDLGHCVLCISSKYGRMGARRIVANLETVDPVVITRQHREVEERDYKEWLAMPGQIRAWYIEANGHEPANEDLGHYLYQWREEHTSRLDIRRRIFEAAKKEP